MVRFVSVNDSKQKVVPRYFQAPLIKFKGAFYCLSQNKETKVKL
ncbi:Hypothetical protein LDBND_0816 [Lactobacillus delbrueckii subsp. bulgaricus ND02]|nr:Hypothetical protein LDBND_0816 [Lactobacillus delbrueckii subsp. bulgaricus ND02]EOD03290.1 hypothetical protein B506_01645 [Lactobacillus delbrueckii subsp. jakobsenii ZN7a-9 = DSM 26046]EPB99121.1 hypothetical protein G134_1684 [Lactobacillus delbrueckii subsp. lactis CRL581]